MKLTLEKRPTDVARCVVAGKFEFGYETKVMWKVDIRGAANLVDPARGRILAFVEYMDFNYYMFFNPQKIGVI